MTQRFDEVNFTVAREVSADGEPRRYIVWTKRATAVVCHVYEATSAADAIRQAREELELAEHLMTAI